MTIALKSPVQDFEDKVQHGSRYRITNADDNVWHIGKSDTYGAHRLDVKLYGATSAALAFLDASANTLTLTGIQLVTSGASPVSFGTLSTPASVATATGTAQTDQETQTGGVGGSTTVATTGTGGVGGGFVRTGGAGGTAASAVTASTGGAGGPSSVTTGAGGACAVATVTATGGASGALTYVTGTGGAVSAAVSGTATGGASGAVNLKSGTGGAVTATSGTNVGGASAAVTLASGTGGAASGGSTNTGGAGGTVNVTGGTGGNGTQTGGAGGTVAIAAGNAGTGGNAAAGNITIVPGTATGSGTAGSVTIGRAAAAVGAGVRIAASRVVLANKPTAPVDVSAGVVATVAQILEAGIFTSTQTANLTLPTCATSSGIVQGLPGTPAVGDIIEIMVCCSHATQVVTVLTGTGSTIFGIATTAPGGGNRIFRGRITSVTANSETITWY